MFNLISSVHISTSIIYKSSLIAIIILVPDSLLLCLSSNLLTENEIAKCSGHCELPSRNPEHHEIPGRHYRAGRRLSNYNHCKTLCGQWEQCQATGSHYSPCQVFCGDCKQERELDRHHKFCIKGLIGSPTRK